MRVSRKERQQTWNLISELGNDQYSCKRNGDNLVFLGLTLLTGLEESWPYAR